MLRVPMNTSQAKRIQLKWWKDEKMEMKSGIRCHLKIPLHLKENFAKSEESRWGKDERRSLLYLRSSLWVFTYDVANFRRMLLIAIIFYWWQQFRLKIGGEIRVKIGSMRVASVIGLCHGGDGHETQRKTWPNVDRLPQVYLIFNNLFSLTIYFKCLSRK